MSSISLESILLCGDFNIPHIHWSQDKLGLIAIGKLSPASSYFIDSISYHKFFQLTKLQNSHGSLLDLIF